MKKKFLRLFAICGLSVFALSSQAQLSDVTQILNGGVGDAEKIMSAYTAPYGKAFALGFSNGWYNTAKPHSLFGFDLTFTTSLVAIPTADQSFDLKSLDLKTLTVGTPSITPTIAGSSDNGGNVILTQTVNTPNGSQSVSKTISLPGGTGLAYIPAVSLQLGFGLPFGTEIMGRFMPTINIGDYGKLGMWGIGFKHDLKQWIPVVSATPFWSLSALVGYSKFKASAATELLPDASTYYTSGVNMNDYIDQSAEITASAFTASLLASTDIPIINVYGGIGFVKTSSNLVLKGVYPLPGIPDPSQITDPNNIKMKVVNSAKDPIDADLNSGTSFKATIGLRLKLALLTIHGDVSSCGGYTLYSAGMGISFR